MPQAKPAVRLASVDGKKTAAGKKRVPALKGTNKIDPNYAKVGRVFELTFLDVYGENNYSHKVRMRTLEKGGLEDQVYDVGQTEAYVGMVSEFLGTAKKPWSPWGFGHVPVERVIFVREVSEIEEIKETEKEKK